MRRMAFRGAPPGTLERSTAYDDSLAARDWLPPALLLMADVVIALLASGNMAVVASAVVAATAYLTLVRRLKGPALGTPAASRGAASAVLPARPATISAAPFPTPQAGTVSKDLKWVQATIAEPTPAQPPPGRSRDRPLG
jgi:hypothetical protein